MCRPVHSLFEIGIIEDDVGRLSAEFESDVLEIALGSCLHDFTPYKGTSRERDLGALLLSH